MSGRNLERKIDASAKKPVPSISANWFSSNQKNNLHNGKMYGRPRLVNREVNSLLGKQPKIIPRDTRTSSQRKKLAAGPELCVNSMKNSLVLTHSSKYTGGEKSKTFVVANSVVNPSRSGSQVVARWHSKKHGNTPNRQTRCSKACKMSPVCAVTPRFTRNYACVDSSTEKMVSGLEAWLSKRGKPLICTNLKEVTASLQLQQNSSKPNEYTQMLSTQDRDEIESKENVPPPMSKGDLLAGALEDLRTLITMGFPARDSEEWLTAIKSCYKDVTCEPLYWECLALLRNAASYQRSALEQGDGFAKQVEELEKKFETLDITSPAIGTHQALKMLRDVDPDNLMTSNAISFAVQESKNGDADFVVTPVRRNKRRHMNMNKDNVCSSYFKISEEIRKKSIFKPNHTLDL